MQDRTILHCDMNNFYASVECMLDPSLRNKPVAVGGDVEKRHGIILAKNYAAKAFGIQTGEALWQARQKCKDLVIVPPHYEEYIKYSKLARSIYEEYTDQVESYGMDECWLDVSGSTGIFGDANNEWEYAGMYADEGISGTRADKRNEFKKMIKDCLDGKIDYVITKSVSRFARNTVDCLDYVRLLKSRGIGIFFEEQNIDTLKSDSELYLIIYAGFAQSESESISKNVTWSLRKNFEEGKPIFKYKQFLGYRKGADGEPEIVPEEAIYVERIFEMYLSGMPVKLISKKLQDEHIVIPGKDLNFGKHMIMNILRNEKYCGDSILQKTVTLDPISKVRKKNTGEAPMYLVQDSHPAIISREM